MNSQEGKIRTDIMNIPKEGKEQSVEVSCKNNIENGLKRTTITIKSFDGFINPASYANMSNRDQILLPAKRIADIATQLKKSYKQLGLSKKDFEERDILLP